MLLHLNCLILISHVLTCGSAVICCSVLRLELTSLGIFKTLPYLVMFLMSNVGGWLGDILILSRQYSVAAARKAVNTIGQCRWYVFCLHKFRSLGHLLAMQARERHNKPDGLNRFNCSRMKGCPLGIDEHLLQQYRVVPVPIACSSGAQQLSQSSAMLDPIWLVSALWLPRNIGARVHSLKEEGQQYPRMPAGPPAAAAADNSEQSAAMQASHFQIHSDSASDAANHHISILTRIHAQKRR